VQVADEVYALPLRSVVETAQINPKFLHRVEGSEVLCLRGETLPLLRLDQLFSARPSFNAGSTDQSCRMRDEARKVVILGVAERRIALLVDHLLGQESTVIKPLGSYLHGCSSLSGATVGGDGRVRLVLDPAGLLQNLQMAAISVSRKASA
jgi:two-component system chemotaxis sensor kinase CheA